MSGPWCPMCSHVPHGAQDRDDFDVRCGAIVGSSSGPMPEPEYCDCVSWAQVVAAKDRAVRVALTDLRAQVQEVWTGYVGQEGRGGARGVQRAVLELIDQVVQA